LFLLRANSDDHVPDLLSRLDISMRFGGLLQRVAAVDDRSQLALLDEPFEEGQITG